MLLQGSSLHSFHLTYLEAWRIISFIQLLFIVYQRFHCILLILHMYLSVFWRFWQKIMYILTPICQQICQKIKYFDTNLSPICQKIKYFVTNFKVHSSSIWTKTKFAKWSSILTPICHQICQTINYFDINFSDSEKWYFKKAVFCGPKFKREGIFHKEIVPTGVGATQKMQQSFCGIWAKI